MRASTFAVLVSLLCVTASARVISYSPYTNQVATPVAQERTTRHFALIESPNPAGDSYQYRQVVLYDTQGDEPRVVYPPGGGSAWIEAAALYQSEGEPGGLRDGDVKLIAFQFTDFTNWVEFSGDGGATWKVVEGLGSQNLNAEIYDVDTGGPYVRGLTNPIRTGNDATPFVVSNGNGVWTIDANGVATKISTRGGRLVGQNREGTAFLVARNQGAPPYHVTLEMLHTGGGFNILSSTLPRGNYYGWIADDDSAYVVAHRMDGRFLYRATPAGFQFIRGPYGASAEPTNVYRDASWFIAVPTSDFNGAWMTQRQPGQPSNLARYTRAGGIEEKWSDVTGPEIEALIAGDSGETVLVQVHRDRSATMMRAFIDPALAVWRVGEPMPRDYDELYLAEEVNKGFVHVDVDRMEAGNLFVFDSGSFQDEIPGDIISPAPGGGGDVVQEWGVVRASLKQRLVLPGVARLPGAYGSFWMTDITLFNPMNEPQDVEIRFVSLDAAAAPLEPVVVTLAPREIRAVPDALGAWFGLGAGGGAIHLLPASGINAFARTYSRAGEGTFGFGMMAIDYFNTTSARFPVTFAGAFPGEHFRTNILLTDTSGKGTDAALRPVGEPGRIGTPNAVAPVGPDGIAQYNSIGNALLMYPHEPAGLVVHPERGTAIATVVSIDNRTNDPTYFPPDLPVAGDVVRAIPVIGHVDGANGARFRSDLYLYNPTSQTRSIALEAMPWTGGSMLIRQFTLLPHEARTIVDVVSSLFQMEGLARLRYWSNDWGDGVRVTSRTYTVEESGATYGSLIPPLNNFQVAGSGDRLEIIGVSGGGSFRTNLAFVEMSPGNVSGAPVGVRVTVINEQGTTIDTFTTQVPHAGGMQINDLFGSRGIAVPAAALITVEVLDDGLVASYATLTDNITNDTTFLGANLGAVE